MATGFSVMDALNKNSKAGVDESPRARFRTKDISIFKMYRNKLNFYDLADIEELAGDILMYGLKQNLEVVFEPNEQGEYRIVAGERRWLALKHLVEQGYKDFEIATCKLTTPQDEDEEQVEIIIANAYRTKSLKDVIEEEQRLKACLERMKMDGKKIKGYDLQSGRLQSIRECKAETVILFEHMKKALASLKEDAEAAGEGYKYDALEAVYIKGKSYEDIVRETGCGKNSPKKWCRSMTERLSIKLFGAKAIENDKIGVK